jgi:excisionase family DNA binding protein
MLPFEETMRQLVQQEIRGCADALIDERIAAHIEKFQREFLRLQMNKPLLLHPKDVAELLHFSRTTVYGMLDRGELPSFKYGSSRLIPYRALEAFIERNLYE